jgi:hypothetical protein
MPYRLGFLPPVRFGSVHHAKSPTAKPLPIPLLSRLPASPTDPPPTTTKMTVTLTAVYASPSDTHTFTVATQTPAATKASPQKEQTAHVAALSQHIAKLQDEVNAYLTERMEVEKRELTGAEEETVEGAEEKYGEEEAAGEED